MLWLLGWVSLALAASPGGFRIDTARAVNSVSLRNVVIVNPDDEFIDQFTPRFTTASGTSAFDAELSGLIQMGPGGDLYGGVGSLRAGYWTVKSSGDRVSRIGVEAWLPVGPDQWRPSSFGSSFHDTLTVMGFQMGWRLSWNETAPWDLVVKAGLAQTNALYGLTPVTELGVVKVVPISDKISIVIEQDFIYPDLASATLRPLTRLEFGESALDLGFQLPWMSADFSGLSLKPVSTQVLTRYQSRF